MSARGRLKSLILDAIAFTYGLALLTYLICQAAGLNEDFFFMNAKLFAGATGVALIIMGGLSEALSRGGIRTLGGTLFSMATPAEPRPFLRTFTGSYLLFVFLLSFYVSTQVTEASLSELFDEQGIEGALRLWKGLTDPNWEILSRATLEAMETLFIAFLATVLAIPVAFVLAFFASKNLMNSNRGLAIYAALRLTLNLSRSVEPLVWALIFTVWVGVGPFAGMLALFIHSVASLMKYYSEVIEGISEGPLDAIRSTGANVVQVVWFGVVPQIVLPYIAMTLYRWDTNVRMATVIGLVGGGGIGTLLITYQGQAMWREVGCIIFVIAAIVWVMDTGSALIREALK